VEGRVAAEGKGSERPGGGEGERERGHGGFPQCSGGCGEEGDEW
jgi:hypothetical protein